MFFLIDFGTLSEIKNYDQFNFGDDLTLPTLEKGTTRFASLLTKLFPGVSNVEKKISLSALSVSLSDEYQTMRLFLENYSFKGKAIIIHTNFISFFLKRRPEWDCGDLKEIYLPFEDCVFAIKK